MKTKEEVFQFLKEHSKPYCKEDKFKNKFQDFYNDLISWDFPENFTFQQKLYHYFMNDPDLKLGLCPTCGNRCKLNSFNKGYYLHCSRKCQNSDEQFKEKIKQTNFKKYGKEYFKIYDSWKTNSRPSDFLSEDMKKKKKLQNMSVELMSFWADTLTI